MFAMTGLEKAIEILGREGVAKAAGVQTPEAVSNWKRRGGVPAKHCRSISDATDGQVSVHDLRPDIFGVAPASEAAA